ncbi:M48 family metalloprotease [Sphingomonas histidinilytica]|jgi:predicted Zn-dependent protease|uniref:Putative Zn-dependent protease, contains TPR repeats n=1 Tax=Rhizorhabdus histidinilytica TaxID=439228 RepID=A0A1T5AY50_9SPHN|nr:M48 family metalloprotease [Rhizorhabdus histidinilytica]MBO9377744.1 M48 family metalloprotease [Rhizorhabdus histidinilytica]QEH79540.1 M48 family metalloprotease [Sphingomonas sp. C8-2]SKB39896.1 Putative Zn-dependent protease, contains TPR repeats [Rhizorhabdus histidinilytica]
MSLVAPSTRRLGRMLRALLAASLALTLTAQPVMAQSILRDAETEAYLKEISAPIVAAAGLQPGNVDIVLVGDKEINAFVAGGQAVYIHSGLIEAADNTNEIQGVIAHEVGHITGGHVIRFGEGARGATGITLLSLLLGAAAMAAGSAEAGMGVMMAGQQAALGKFLAFNRVQESSADAAGVGFLNKAGISGKGMLSFFLKLRKEEYRYASTYAEVDPFMQTHPMSGEREATLSADVLKSPAYNNKTDPALDAKFKRIKAKLIGYMDDPTTALRKYPESDQSAAAHYARAYAWHRGAYPDKAVEEVEKLVASDPKDPYYRELQGQILLESGKPKEAIGPLRIAVQGSRSSPLISSLLGHALLATEDPALVPEARDVLKVAVARDRDNPFAWYTLGMAYSRLGDEPRAQLATAERYALLGNDRLAMASAEAAMTRIPRGTPDYIRAEDIALSARAAASQRKK